jgi:hypothetical protein
MKRPEGDSDRNAWIDQAQAKQRNIVWPDSTINSLGVTEFLWRGSANPTLAQRIGAWLFGLTFLIMAVVFFDIGWRDGSVFNTALSLIAFIVAVRIFRNGFRKKGRNP